MREDRAVARPLQHDPDGFAGPNLLAMVLFEKFAQRQPLNRQRERYAREGIELSLSTLTDQVGLVPRLDLPQALEDLSNDRSPAMRKLLGNLFADLRQLEQRIGEGRGQRQKS